MNEVSNEFVEKESKLGIIILVIIFLGIIGCGGYFGYNYYLSYKENKEKEQEEVIENEQTKERELTVTESKKYLEIIDTLNGAFSDNFFEEEGKITNQQYLNFAYWKLIGQNKTVTAENMKDILKIYFGNDNEIYLDDVVCGNDNRSFAKYDKENDRYVNGDHDEFGHGGGGVHRIYTNYVTSVVSDDVITVTVKNIFAPYCSDICGPADAYYATYNDAKNEENEILKGYEDEHNGVKDEDYEKIKEKIPNTIYKFVKDSNDNFYFDSVSVEK